MNPAQALVNAPNLCLATPGQEYVVYAPAGGGIALDLSGFSHRFPWSGLIRARVHTSPRTPSLARRAGPLRRRMPTTGSCT